VAWAQEEPKNMGGWTTFNRLRAVDWHADDAQVHQTAERASPAEGYQTSHAIEQARIVGCADVRVGVEGKRRASLGKVVRRSFTRDQVC
jgi:2-oxoglutarate dehydrogenase complex dehydrogenase (E1) component-like enzyme